MQESLVTVDDISMADDMQKLSANKEMESNAPKLRQGLKEFRNNKNYQYAEKWVERNDGTLSKKIVLDDGFG